MYDVLIKIEDISSYKLLKRLNEQNINIKKVIYGSNYTYLKVSYQDYQKITKKIPFFEPEIVEYYGLLNIKKVFNNYYIIIISMVLSFLIVFFSSNLIVDVIVIHENEDLKELIINDLYDYGIKKFTMQKSFKQITNIKKKIKNKHLDKIEWLEIRKSGMRYIVDIEERIINDTPKEKDYCHVIATKDGLIKRINVYDGEGVVSFNDYVKKGDILISGDVKLNDNVVSHSCASGDVYAEVWYTVNVKVPLKYYENKFTGKKRNNYIINFNGIDYKIFNDRLKDYESSKKKIFDLLGVKIYLEKDEEIEKKALKYTEKEALEKGLLLAKEKILLKLKKDDLIIDEKILQNRLIDSTMDIDIFIITQEYIGQTVEAKEDEINDL